MRTILYFGGMQPFMLLLARADGFDGGSTHVPRLVDGSGADHTVPGGTLAARIRAGDDSAFGELYLTYAPKLIPFAYGYVHTRAVAEELVHDVFLSIWAGRATWMPQGGVAAYLYAAVRNRALKVMRHDAVVARSGPLIVAERSDVATSAAVDERAGDSTTSAEALVHAIAQLSERSREALTLRWNHEMSFREIGQVLGVSEDAARVRVARAEKVLREMLGPLMER